MAPTSNFSNVQLLQHPSPLKPQLNNSITMPMSPTPSITKQPILSSSSGGKPRCNSTAFPRFHPSRRAYLLARIASTILGLLQIICAATAFSLLSRRRWLDPCLSPAITSFIYSSIEIFSALYWRARAYHLTRALYDGVIAAGFAVAIGFFVKIALPTFQNAHDGGGSGAAVLGGVILGCMLSQILVHAGVSVEGWRETVRIHKEKKETRDISLDD
jgi:hypothetical protein